jgi:hypothetical protein
VQPPGPHCRALCRYHETRVPLVPSQVPGRRPSQSLRTSSRPGWAKGQVRYPHLSFTSARAIPKNGLLSLPHVVPTLGTNPLGHCGLVSPRGWHSYTFKPIRCLGPPQRLHLDSTRPCRDVGHPAIRMTRARR